MSAAAILPIESRLIEIPVGAKEVELTLGRRTVRLTNLQKILWPRTGATKRDLLQYYADLAPVLFPHLSDRAMVLPRYPKPSSIPNWVETCPIEQAQDRVIECPLVQDLASLLWVINLGSIDLNPWNATCDDVSRPDYLHFDLEPARRAGFAHVLDTALAVRDALLQLEIQSYAKTTGSRGIHIYMPIVRGPVQADVSRFAMTLAQALAPKHPRVLIGHKQNARGRTLASVYSVRHTPTATVSAPVSWAEIERGIKTEDFRMDNMPARLRALDDLWKPMLVQKGRLRLDRLLG